jgi:hypothetical protein
MRPQISRILVLVAMVGLLVFASAPSSKAVATQTISACCFNCRPVYDSCINAGNSEASCCWAYRNCTRQCNPPAICTCGLD